MITFTIKQGLKDIPEATYIREEVFMKEQGFHDEFDAIDDDAYHIVIYIDDKPVACGRMFVDNEDLGTYIIGRIATLKQYRGQHLASTIMQKLEEKAVRLGAKKIKLSAQVSAQAFYEKLGYVAIGAIYLDEHCPHRTMIKELKSK